MVTTIENLETLKMQLYSFRTKLYDCIKLIDEEMSKAKQREKK